MSLVPQLKASIGPLRQRLLDHPIYSEVNSREWLHTFMEAHVFAVWDFMTLAKRLQRELTCLDFPWRPPEDPTSARFINEIVLGEESDVDREGCAKSHLELYMDGMREIGAPLTLFDNFLNALKSGHTPSQAFEHARVPAFVQGFVSTTLDQAHSAPIVEVASAFLFGREDIIPEMFERLLALWDRGRTDVPIFAYYLDRHIELDGDEHGPMAEKLIDRLIGTNEERAHAAEKAAIRAIQSRIALWDGVLSKLTAVRPAVMGA